MGKKQIAFYATWAVALLWVCVGFASWAQAPASDSASSASLSVQPSLQPSQQSSLQPEVRLLIDISGSMKKTDPHNLRRPAVELLARLLPNNSRAGIWTFAEGVAPLMPLALVDDAWREQAAARADRIGSSGLLTHIGSALSDASQAPLPRGYKGNIVLLTDGVVDIGPQASANLSERRRVLSELLPALKAQGFVIHTLALSADADQELLQRLAQASDGSFALANTAEELMQAFLRIFDQAVPAERLPLRDNTFNVDSSIHEFTALIFREPNTPASRLIAPDGREFKGSDSEQQVNWHHTAQYDLITVREPAPGLWQVNSKMAPNSRITVVSDLQLRVEPLPNQLRQGQPIQLQYRFVEEGNTLTNNEFLHLLSAEVALRNNDEPLEQISLNASPQQGVFVQALAPVEVLGDVELRLNIDGKTFAREFVHRLQVSEALFTLAQTRQGDSYEYRVAALPQAVEKGSARVSLHLSRNGEQQPAQTLAVADDGTWHYAFTPTAGAQYQLRFYAEGNALDGSPFGEWLEEQPVAIALPPAPSPPAVAAPPAEKASMFWWYLALGISNLLVLILAYVVYRLIKNNRADMRRQEQALALAATAGAMDLAASEQELPLDLMLDDPQPAMAEPAAMVASAAMSESPLAANALQDEALLPLDDLLPDNPPLLDDTFLDPEAINLDISAAENPDDNRNA